MLGSVVSIQFGQALGKSLFDVVGPTGAVALRLGLAALILCVLHRPAPPRTRAEVVTVLGLGTAIAGMNLIYLALVYLPLGLATSLQLLGPITLALVTSRRWVHGALAALAGGGVWLFHGGDGTGFSLPGVLLALASGACMAAYLLLSSRAGAASPNARPLALAVTWAAMLTVPFGVVDGGTALLGPRALATGLVVAVLSAVLPYSLELSALRRLPARTVGVLQSLEPATAGLAGTVVLSEHLRAVQWLALGCVSAASAGTVALSRQRSPRREGAVPACGRRAIRDGGAAAFRRPPSRAGR